MTTAFGAQPDTTATAEVSPADLKKNHFSRRKRTTEKVLAALFLVAGFVVTVVLLGLQWLGNQSSASSAPIHTSHTYISEVRPS
jgi:hypothetical protein